MRRRRFLRLALVSMLGIGLLLTWNWLPFFGQAAVAQAHAFVIGSDPVDGSTIAAAPSTVRIFFNADISSASRALVFVYTPGGPSAGSKVDAGRSFIPAGASRELDTPLLSPSTLPQGSYEVRWTAIANDDGHATQGLIGFNVGASATGLTGTPILGPSTSNFLPQMSVVGMLAVMWNWLMWIALMFWIGIIVMEGLLLIEVLPASRGAADNAARLLRKHAHPLRLLCLAALLVGEIVSLLLRGVLLTQAQGSSGINLQSIAAIMFNTNYGHLWMIRIALLGAALAFAWRTAPAFGHASRASSQFRQLRRAITDEQKTSPESAALDQDEPVQEASDNQTPRPATVASTPAVQTMPARLTPTTSTSASIRTTVIWCGLAALLVLTIAYAGNTAQLAQTHVTALVLSWSGLLAQATWFGGIAYLGYILLPLLPAIEPDAHGELLVNTLRYYTPLLLAALAVLLVSTLFSIETTITDPAQFLNDPYGRTLLVSLLLYLLMLIFTAYGFFILLPGLRRQVVLLPVVGADMPARRARRSALEQTVTSVKRAMHVLSVLGVGILLCAALMAFYAPPIVFPPLSTATSAGSTGSAGSGITGASPMQKQTIGNLTVSLIVLPARVDSANTVIVTLQDANGAFITDARIQLTTNMQVMDMGIATKEAQTGGNGNLYEATFRAGEAFSMAGDWVISLAIQRPGQPALAAQFVVLMTA